MAEKPEKIHIVTLAGLPHHKTLEVKGLVWASTVRSRFFLYDLLAFIRMLLGGEIKEYHELTNEARNAILRKLADNARRLDANAVLGMRLNTSQIFPGTLEVVAYGTAARVKRGR